MKYTAYANRAGSDAFFMPDEGSAHYEGALADAVRWVEQAQLMDPALWSLMVDQFRQGNVDDGDRWCRSEYWGKMMRGASFTYAYTQNEELYKILEATVEDLLTTQDEFGRITTYSVPKEFHGWDIWGRKYVLLGLQYFLEICKNDELADRIVDAMRMHTDYIMEKIGSEGVAKQPITNTSEWWGGLNSSTLLEPVVRLYSLTKDQKYLDFAADIIKTGGCTEFNLFETALADEKAPYQYPVTKAYEMMSCFEGVLEYYRVTGEKKYLTTVLNFVRKVMDTDITVIGCAGTTHELFDHSKINQFNPAMTQGVMQETCVTVTWMKFCYQLLCLTGDPVFADRMEESARNALMASINFEENPYNGEHEPCRGQIYAFDSYCPLLNGWHGRRVGGHGALIPDKFWWGCCVAIGSAGTGLIPMAAAMPARDGAAVNFYLPGEFTCRLPEGGSLTLRTETDYPVGDTVKITVLPGSPASFTLSVRIPAWSAESALTVNGEPAVVVPGTYARLTREWKPGDTVELKLDMRVRILRATEVDPEADEASRCHAVLLRGPIVLARDSRLGGFCGSVVNPVDFGGFAEAAPSHMADFPVLQEYSVISEEGAFPVVDYASAGRTWDPELPMTAWLTTK